MEYFETMRGRPIYNLQTFLRGLSKMDEMIYPVVPDGIFGEDTKRSVESFQAKFELPITGEADSDTWDAIVREYEKYERFLRPVDGVRIIRNDEIIKKGDKHDGVYIIQSMIESLSDKFTNINSVAINGIYDDLTDAEVRKLKEIFAIEEEDITKEFINNLVSLYEHAVVFKSGFYDGTEEAVPTLAPAEEVKEPERKVKTEDNKENVIVWKFF